MSPKQRVARPVRAPRAACWCSGRHGARASAPLVLGVQPMPAGGSTYCTPTRCFRAARCTPPCRTFALLLPPPCSTPPRCTPVRPVGLRPVARSPCCTLLLARTTRWTPPRRSPARWTPPRCSGATRRTPTCVLRPTRWSAHPARREVKSSAARTRSYLTQILTPIYLPLRYSGDVYQCFLARAMRSGGATRSSCCPTGCSSD